MNWWILNGASQRWLYVEINAGEKRELPLRVHSSIGMLLINIAANQLFHIDYQFPAMGCYLSCIETP